MASNPNFDDWYRETYQTVLAAALIASGNDRACAEDATSDAFIEAFRRWRTVSAMESPHWWTTKVATNRVRRSQRGKSRRQNRETTYETDRSSKPNTEGQSSRLDPIWAAIENLSPRQRQAVILRYVEGLPQVQAAQRMGIAPGTAAATLNQARSNLRETLATHGKDTP